MSEWWWRTGGGVFSLNALALRYVMHEALKHTRMALFPEECLTMSGGTQSHLLGGWPLASWATEIHILHVLEDTCTVEALSATSRFANFNASAYAR